MNGIGDFVTSIKETHRLAAQVVVEIKGESAGHPFRGNQWTGGGGASGSSDSGSSGGNSVNSIKVFHGTNADFEKFELSPTVSGNEMGEGVYFTVDRNRAAGYGKNIHEVSVNVKHPIDVNSDKPIGEHLAKAANEYIGDADVVSGHTFSSLDDVRKFRNEIGDKLYAMDQTDDGFIVYAKQRGVDKNTTEGDLYKIVRQERPRGSSQVFSELGFDAIVSDRDVVVFSPDQIEYGK